MSLYNEMLKLENAFRPSPWVQKAINRIIASTIPLDRQAKEKIFTEEKSKN